MAQLASALAWGARGRLFESDHPDNIGGGYSAPFLYNIMYCTYILFSQKVNKFYTGQTEDLSRRIEEHNRGKTSFLASGIPWKLIYFKEFKTRAEAINLEMFIKKRDAGRYLLENNIQLA